MIIRNDFYSKEIVQSSIKTKRKCLGKHTLSDRMNIMIMSKIKIKFIEPDYAIQQHRIDFIFIYFYKVKLARTNCANKIIVDTDLLARNRIG